jgi:hypothetical protein
MRLLAVFFLGTGATFAQLAVGVKGGLPFTDFLRAADNPGATFHSGSTRFIVGPTIELRFPAGVGLELDALYRRFDYRASETILTSVFNNKANNSWEFPLLLKYRAPGVIVRPFVDAGVAFEHWRGLRQVTDALGVTSTSSEVKVTNTGVVLGGGLEIRLPVIRVSPELRFTRWGAKDISELGSVFRSNQNQAEVLIGITF